MKKLFYIILPTLLMTSCESELDGRHYDPDGFTEARIEYLYTSGLSKSLETSYGDYYSYIFRALCTYTQTLSRQSGDSRMNTYRVESDWGKWENHYITKMKEIAEINKIYDNELSTEEQELYAPFMKTIDVIKAYNVAMASDFFGDMPYSEAWGARNGIHGATADFTAKYDSQKDIYYSILEDLKNSVSYFKTASLQNIALHTTTFKKQDILFGGDFAKWSKFANSLRLRYAMRISNVDENKAKEVLSDIQLSDLITSNADNAYIYMRNVTNTAIWRGIIESHRTSNGYYVYAPDMMVELLTAANDPRLRVFFQPASDDNGVVIGNITDQIVPYPACADEAIAITAQSSTQDIRNKYSIVNSVTYRNNYKLPTGVAMTAADVYFCLAEARLRNLTTQGSVEDYYNKGVIASVQEYFNYYKNSTDTPNAGIAATDVSETALLAWLNNSTFKYNQSRALELIATQKWMNFGILQPFECWAEYRRLDLPVLKNDTENGTILNGSNAPVRLVIPTSEMTLNGENYKAVADKNYSNSLIWWDTKKP